MAANQRREQLERERDQEASFQHTQLGVYLAGAFGLMYLWASSAQGIVDKYHFSKRWFYLYGALCLFAYLYMRPFVRRGLGSAGRGYLNFGTLYICWLCSAVFCHLPSFEALGLDMKADVSLGLSIAASSFLVLGVMHGVQQLLIHFRFLTPAPGATQQAVWTCVLLNTLTLAMTCSTYFQLCGNGGTREGLQDSSFLHQAVCGHWLAPIATKEYPNFSAWMLYGEHPDDAVYAAAPAPPPKTRGSSGSGSIFNASFWFGSPAPPPPPPEDPFGLAFNTSQLAELVSHVSGPDSNGSVISPVFTMWITLVALYIVNVLADHVAANNMSARHISELRRDLVPDPDIALLAQLSTAAGITLRENAHQWAAAQQQRHEEARRGLAGNRSRTPGLERPSRAKKHSGIKRSKSLESHRPGKQPWSPRFMMERTLVNLLETTSSFSFKAAALLEGKPFTWQDGLQAAASGAVGAAAAAAGGVGGSFRRRSHDQQQWRQRRQQQQAKQLGRSISNRQREGVSDSVQSMSPASAASAAAEGGAQVRTGAAANTLGSLPPSRQQLQHIGEGSMQPEPSFRTALPPVAGGCNASSSSSSTTRPRALRHHRSRSLSSIHSGDTASLHDDDEQLMSAELLPRQPSQQRLAQQQQQQQQHDEIQMPSVPSITSPFARVAHAGTAAFDRCGFGSTISLHQGTPPSSHRWQQQRQQRQQQHAAAVDASSTTSSRGHGVGSAGSPATATPASSAAGPTPPTPAAAAAAAAAAAGVDAAQPPFLDMVPWYSGTSADLFKTMFDLLISVKLFLGRFDMRTMQAATAASMAEHPSHSTPQEGDGFTYEHFADRTELWLDFIADTGDGGNPTYAVARALAAQELVVPVAKSSSSSSTSNTNKLSNAVVDSKAKQQQPQHQQASASNRFSSSSSSILEGATGSGACQNGQLELPRGEVLLIGGDLAYPNPSRETFEQRLFVPFQEALPPPPHYHPGRLVVHKPDLPPAFGPPAPATRLGGIGLPVGLSPRASRGASVAALREYGGPNAFAIPGNHDWIDGLETFIQQIQHKGWLGGWLLPQEKSYFALRLPAGWWVFGLDLALVGDIDMCQYRYFANLIEQRLGPNDNVIIITHEPTWLLEWFWASSSSSNLRQLVRGHLRGRARVHLAGDLHFYMRHSYCGGSGSGTRGGGEGAQQQNEASVAAAVAAAAAADAASGEPQQQQQQQADGVGMAGTGCGPGVGGVGGSAAAGVDVRRLSTSSAVSSSSGVDSCMSGPDSHAAEPAAGGRGPHHHRNHYHGYQQQQQQQQDGFTAGARVSNSSSHSSSTAGGSPVRHACKTLPRLQLGRSSWEGLDEDRPQQDRSRGGSHRQGAADAAAELVDSPADTGVFQQFQLQQQQYQQQHTGPRSRMGDTAAHGLAAAGIHVQRQQQQHSFMDPEHLIVNGMGGAFMHPTHVFSYSRFAVLDDEAATATAAIYSSSEPHRNINGANSAWNNDMLSWHCPMSPSGCSDTWEQHEPLAQPPPPPAAAAAGANGHSHTPPAAAAGNSNGTASGAAAAADSSSTRQQQSAEGHAGAASSSSMGGAGSSGGASGIYKCAALFPSAATSLSLGRNNLHLFRFKNSRFDVIGGAIYFLSIVSILPRCNAGLALLSSTSLWDFGAVFMREFAACWYSVFMESYLSLGMSCAFFLLCLGFAKGGGVGAVSGERQEQQQAQAQRARSQQQRLQQHGTGPAPAAQAGVGVGAGGAAGGSSGSKQKRSSPVVGPFVKLRTGGSSNQLLVAMLHTGAHLGLAIVLLLLLELGVEVCIKYESLGNDGMGSMYRWFEAYQDEHFPDPMGLRTMAHKWSLGLYPGVIKAAMAVYDIPEAIAVVRNVVCAAPNTAAGFASLTRLQVWAYYGGMLAYYWLLAIPAMGFVFGLYLYISVCWFHVHYDEAFSALRIANYKGLSRLHITPEGDLEIFTLGMDRVPTSWREDPRWYGPGGAGNGRMPSHVATYPSRWVPAESCSGEFDAGGLWDGTQQQGGEGDDEKAAEAAGPASMGLRLVDYVKVPRIRPPL